MSEKKRVSAALFTYHFSDNYGALMQAYALRKWLLDRGVSADFINYHPSYVEEGGRLDRPWRPALWRKNAAILYIKQAHYRRMLFGNAAELEAFTAFRASHLGVSGPRIRDATDLAAEIKGYDLLICGSDQIWNPSIQRGLDPVYFLDIEGAEQAHKVAYAPSFGRSEIEATHLAELGRLLAGLDAVSVREASGLDILESARFQRERANVMPDPTILLGGFEALLQRSDGQDGSVFCYALRTDEVIRDVAEEAARLVRGSLYAPRNPHQRWRDIGQGVAPGPVEWLRMIARAQVVVSNSFHGVALSLVLNRPFIAVGLPGKRTKMNARVENLLNIAGLTDRILYTADRACVKALLETPIDWTAANARLASVRVDAEAFLDVQIAQAQTARA